jgi:hypothetical protein
MTMTDIWLTVAAEAAFRDLQATAPSQATAVSDAINDIPAHPGQRIDLPGAPPEAPFLAKEPTDLAAPVVIYRHALGSEQGEWLVVFLMSRDDYREVRRAEQRLAYSPPVVRDFVHAVVGTLAAATVNARPGTVTFTPQHGSGETD